MFAHPHPTPQRSRARLHRWRTGVLAPIMCAALALTLAPPAFGDSAAQTLGAQAPSPSEAQANLSPELTDLLASSDSAAGPFRNALDLPIGTPPIESPPAGEPGGGTPAAPPEAKAPRPASPEPDDTPSEDWLDDRSGRVELLVYFADTGVAPAAQGDPELAAASLQSEAERHWDRIERGLAELTDTGAVEVLNRFWVTSAVLVSAEPTERVLTQLAALPGATEVTPNYTVEPLDDTLPNEVTVDPEEAAAAEAAAEAADAEAAALAAAEIPVTYGISKIGADDAWRDFGARGQGVRVAVLDTGVDASHPDIGSRLVGRGTGDPTYPGGWINFDRLGKPLLTKPTDPGSHGTHVAGTVLGGAASGTSIGVAPDAELMAANVLSGGGSTAKLLSALEWVISPFDGNGAPAGRAADVVNMSLGSGDFEEELAVAIRNVRDAGIFPAIAIGNKAGTTSAPGNYYDAVAVGMTNADDAVDPQSSGGIVSWGAKVPASFGWPESYVKPDISAPGVNVFSAMPGGKFGDSSGTSMATPHVAGAVALMRSAQAGLSVTEIADALARTAWHPNPGSGPDISYGAGRINVHAAISSVRGEAGIKGQVVNATTGTPVAGATISYAERGETWTTDARGRFTARLAPGSYTLTVQRFGYETAQSAALTVAATGFAELSLPMTPITTGTLSGTVLDHATSAPVAGAAVSIAGYELTTTTDAQGAYRFDNMPVGEYQVRASAAGKSDSVSRPAPVKKALTTTVTFRLADLTKVLVLGDAGGRTAALLADNGFVADSQPDLPSDLSVLGSYDAVLWDTPAGDASRARIEQAIAATDASGSGIVWLDLGDGDASGLAAVATAFGDPAGRATVDDREASRVGYQVVADHEILADGMLSPETLAPGAIVVQNSASVGSKFAAWFEQIRGSSATVIANTVLQYPDGTPENPDRLATQVMGSGLAVDQRAGNRHAYLSLHGSAAAVDARSWSPSGVQVLLNTVKWAAPVASQAPEPEIGFPKPPVVVPPVVPPVDPPVTPPVDPPVKPGVERPGVDNPGGGKTAVVPPPAAPAQAPAAQNTASPAAGAATRAPSSQATPKPETKPDPPFASARELTKANAAGVKVRVEEGIAYITIPDSSAGDWFFLHVYPQRTPIDWIRANTDGELRVDISRLTGGKYQFAFTARDNSFAGWVEVAVPQTAQSPRPAGLVDEDPTQLSGLIPAAPEASGGLALTAGEQFMLLGSALLILAAAGVVLFGQRKRPASPASGPGVAAGAAAG